jgi:hypothetical protein
MPNNASQMIFFYFSFIPYDPFNGNEAVPAMFRRRETILCT